MSDYSSMATSQNSNQPTPFEAAVHRAKLVAAKIEVSSNKRPLEEGLEPNAKKLASFDQGYQGLPPTMSAPMPPQHMNTTPPMGGGLNSGEQMLNEYIRVPDKMVGLIIGRGGEQITRLQAESGCKIQMAPDSGGQPDRVCTLTGTREAITRAKDLVNQIVNHRGRENALDGPPMMGGGPPPSSNQGMQRPNNGNGGGGGGGGGGLATMEEIMLPGPKVGLIIGKSGKTIKQLQEQSGAKMVVIQDGPNTEYEKPLRISGDPSKVEHAKQLVFELLADKEMGGPPQRPQQQQYDDYQEQGNGQTNNAEVLVPKVAVGVVIGRGGEMIKKIQAETGCRVQFHQERDDGPGDKRCYLQGKPHQVDAAREMIDDLISSVTRREQEIRGGGGGGGGGRGGFRGGGNQRNGGGGDQWQPDKQEIRVTFTVNNVKCGLIIGRGGEVIKQINAMTGAHCELDRKVQNADRNNRTFFIKGHPESVEHCKRVIMEKCSMPINFIHEGSGGGGGGGGGSGSDSEGGDMGYGGGGGAPPAWGYNPHWHPANNQQPPQQQVPVNPSTGQLDYSQQWIDYYRSLGLMREAEAIEMQMKQNHGGGGGGGPPGGGPGPSPAPAPGGPAPAPAPGGPGAAPGGSAAPDYSAQWAEYYRSIGKLKEAEAIEVQIKLKQQQQGGGQPSLGGGGPGTAPGGPGGAPGGAPPQSGGTPPAPQQPYPGYAYPGMQYPYPYPYPQDHQQ